MDKEAKILSDTDLSKEDLNKRKRPAITSC